MHIKPIIAGVGQRKRKDPNLFALAPFQVLSCFNLALFESSFYATSNCLHFERRNSLIIVDRCSLLISLIMRKREQIFFRFPSTDLCYFALPCFAIF